MITGPKTDAFFNRTRFVATSALAILMGPLLISNEAGAAIRLLVPGSVQRLPVEPRLLEGRTPLGDLIEKFEAGKGVSVREVRGWYAGRCYYNDSPTRPVASLLVVEPGLDRKAHGPVFEASEYRLITPMVNISATADYFDELDEPKRQAVRNAIVRYQSVNAFPVNSKNALVIEGMRTTDFESREYAIRRLGKNLFLRLTCNEASYCLNYRNETADARVVASSGESPAHCYYFKPVQ